MTTMAWYPGATRMELQPESDTQPAIRHNDSVARKITHAQFKLAIHPTQEGT